MSKKLLSVLVVLALALSMVPVVGLPATKANAATVDHTTNLFPAGTTDQQTANCPVCGGSQTWYELNTIGGTSGMNADKAKTHYYLSEDYTMGSGWWGNLFGTQGRDICLHLNGNELTAVNRFFSTDLKKLNIIAGNGGSVIYNGGSYYPLFNYGNFNLYGGTYTDNTGDGMVKLTSGSLNLYDVTMNSDVIGNASVSTRITLYGTTTINGVADFSATGSLGLTDWSGSITEYVPYAGDSTGVNATTGAIASDRMIVSGTITGTIGNLAWNGTTFACVVAIATVNGSPANAAVDAFYPTVAAAVAAYGADAFANDKIIKLFADAELTLSSGINYYVNANGNDITVKGAGTLHPIDSLNDTDYALTYGKWDLDEFTGTLDDDVTCGANRYLTIKEGDAYTAHRILVEVSKVSLKTSAAGIYFKAVFYGDATIASRIESYGVAVSKTGMPTSLEGVRYSELTDKSGHNGKYFGGNSAAVIDILQNDATLDNLDRATTDIYGKAYIKIDMDGESDTAAELVMGTREYVKCSLASVLGAIDTKWTDYTTEQQEIVNTFYNTWKNVGAEGKTLGDLTTITFTNIGK